MIPNVIHRIWLGDPMPPAFQRFGQRWRALHPGWTVTDWTSRSAVATLDLPACTIREQAKAVLPHDWKRFEADVLRLELLYVLGGLYVDADVEPLMSVDTLLHGHSCVVARSPHADKHGHHAITNCVMAAAPGHPWIRALIDGLPGAIHRYGKRHLARMIGPWHLDRTYTSGAWPDVHVLAWNDMRVWLTHHWNSGLRRRGVGLG
jgi:mannosyltransferase OCH1-like enzyme